MGERYILLVDDEKNILSSLTRELHEWGRDRGYQFLTASSGVEGLSVLEQKGAETEIIVSDLRMPDMSGSDFLKEAKRLYPDIVSILLSGFSDAQEVAKAVSAGIFSFLLKPWDRAYLVSEVDKASSYFQLLREKKQSALRLEEELRWAGEMQRAFLKPALASTTGVEFRVSYRPLPSMRCGGDYYDVVSMGSDRYLMLLGDVAGHGIRAAFVTGILKAVIYPEYLRSFYGKAVSPSDFLGWLNDRMNFELRSSSDLLVTFFAGFLDVKERSFRYANAGQCRPFIVRGSQVAELPVHGQALGVGKSVHFPEQSVGLKEDDVIFLFTDGLSELRGTGGEQVDAKLPALLAKTPYSSDYHKKILEGALSSAAVGDFSDDVTILSARMGKSGT